MHIRRLRIIAPLAIVSLLGIAAEGDAEPELMPCDTETELVAEGEEFTTSVQASPVPYPQLNGPRDGTPMWTVSTVTMPLAFTNDVDADQGEVQLDFNWDSPAGVASDIDIYVFDAEGSLVTDSTGDNTTEAPGEVILIAFEPCATYEFDIQNWAAVNAPTIEISATVTSRYTDN